MFEELKTIVDMIAHLPTPAVWVLAGLLLYKLAIIRSIYGFLRFAIESAPLSHHCGPRNRCLAKGRGRYFRSHQRYVHYCRWLHKLLIGQLERIKVKAFVQALPIFMIALCNGCVKPLMRQKLRSMKITSQPGLMHLCAVIVKVYLMYLVLEAQMTAPNKLNKQIKRILRSVKSYTPYS